MFPALKKNRIVRLIGQWLVGVADKIDNKSLAVQIMTLVLTIGLISFFMITLESYKEAQAEITSLIEANKPILGRSLPTQTPFITQGVGLAIVFVSFLMSLRLQGRLSARQRERLVKMIFWIAAIGVLVAWLPSDYAVTKAGLEGKSDAGEVPSTAAYWGKLILMGLLILSFPVTVMLHYRSTIMDQYVVRNFMTPFVFCMVGFVAIWIIWDLIDNATDLAGGGGKTVLRFYVVQLPYVILFVLPATLLLSLLYSLSRMSTSNEFISMLGAGRSVLRVLRPLFLIGLYCTLVALVFKYEWAPRAIGYKESLLATIEQNRLDKKRNRKFDDSASKIAKMAWMHVNEIDNRTWFVGKVPRNLADKMFSVVIWQMGDDGRPDVIWKARSARWIDGTSPPEWWLYAGKSYTYDENGVPRVQSFEKLRLPGFRETPWKVLSSSQDPEHLGLPGLTLYLKTNHDYAEEDLARFRTNWWDTFAEPFWCLVMVLVAAPLGIVYSRRGVLGGVAASIIIFALMYVARISLITMGQANVLPSWIAAWGQNVIFGLVGGGLLWFRARNRELPKLKTIFVGWPVALWKRVVTRESVEARPVPRLVEPNPVLHDELDIPLDPEALHSLEETLAKIKTDRPPGDPQTVAG